MKTIYVFEKREATGYEKATKTVYEVATGLLWDPLYMGIEEAEERLPVGYYPEVKTIEKSRYIPVKYRSDKYLIVK